MTTKTKVTIGVVVLAVAFASGRYSVHAPSTKTVETVKTDTQIKRDKDMHKKTVIVKEPTGRETTTITEETETTTNVNKETNLKLDESVTQAKRSTVNVSALGGIDLHTHLPTYGVSASKEFIGPITLGAFGLTNGVLGVSIGIDF